MAGEGAAPPFVAAEEGQQARHLGQHSPPKDGATVLLPWSRHGCRGRGIVGGCGWGGRHEMGC